MSRRQSAQAAALLGAAGVLASLHGLPQPLELPSSSFAGAAGLSASDASNLIEGDRLIRSIWLGRLAYPAMVAALEVGLFEALRDRPLPRAALGRRLTPPLPPRALEALTSTCASLGLLEVTDGGDTIALAKPAAPFLLQGSKYYWGPQLLAADGTHASLRRALVRSSRAAAEGRSDDRGAAEVKYDSHSAQSIAAFIASMEAHSAATAVAAARVLDMSSTQRLLDMAGGSGCFSRELCKRHPQLTATVADVPAVVQIHKQGTYIEPQLRKRVLPAQADLFDSSSWPRQHDCVLLANVLHDWSVDEGQAILRNAHTALPTSGQCVLVEALLDDNAAGPEPAALYSVAMLLGDWRSGKQLSFKELRRMLMEAGFSKVERGPPIGAFHSAVIATK